MENTAVSAMEGAFLTINLHRSTISCNCKGKKMYDIKGKRLEHMILPKICEPENSIIAAEIILTSSHKMRSYIFSRK